MNKHYVIGIAVAALFAGAVQAAPIATATSIVEREASEGTRGRDNERAGDRQRRGGRAIEDSNEAASAGMLLSREGRASGGNRQRGGTSGRLIEDANEAAADTILMSREGRASGGNRQRRGGEGRLIEETTMGGELIAREASEGARGRDNERAGDRQRRGGRAG